MISTHHTSNANTHDSKFVTHLQYKNGIVKIVKYTLSIFTGNGYLASLNDYLYMYFDM